MDLRSAVEAEITLELPAPAGSSEHVARVAEAIGRTGIRVAAHEDGLKITGAEPQVMAAICRVHEAARRGVDHVSITVRLRPARWGTDQPEMQGDIAVS